MSIYNIELTDALPMVLNDIVFAYYDPSKLKIPVDVIRARLLNVNVYSRISKEASKALDYTVHKNERARIRTYLNCKNIVCACFSNSMQKRFRASEKEHGIYTCILSGTSMQSTHGCNFRLDVGQVKAELIANPHSYSLVYGERYLTRLVRFDVKGAYGIIGISSEDDSECMLKVDTTKYIK